MRTDRDKAKAGGLRGSGAGPGAGEGSGSGSKERDLILGAIAQADSASSVGGASGALSDPDAPTSAHPSAGVSGGMSGVVRESHPEAPTSAHDPSGGVFAQDEVPVDAFPGYEILREIHRGGQGVVYQAMQLTTKRKVAIKVMHGGATLGSTGRARFEREVQVLGQLNHPNIVKLHDSGITADGSFFYVMDYISGKPLDQVIREQRRAQRKAERESIDGRTKTRSRHDHGPDIRETLALMVKVCEAVNAAHLRGVIHRDIKPANVRIDSNGEPIVVDFGLAKAASGMDSDIDDTGPMTITGQFIGSLPWASPEQAEGSAALDVRTDVYSIGVVLYQMLTGGKFPYRVVGPMREVLDNIVGTEPARPSTVRKRIDDEVETIVMKSLAKERERRYQSAGELARDLKRYLEGEAIEAKRDSAMYVLRKTVKRHKVPAAFAASLAVVTVLFGIGMTGAWSQASAARDLAETRAVVIAQERDRAEDNFEAVRGLANTFLFDFHDAIENLRGATEARVLVLTKAQEYLERIESQASDDPRFLMELAAANDRVGDIRGGMYMASTGTTRQAEDYYSAALRIREGVRQAIGETPEVLAGIADSTERLAGVAQKQGRFDDAIAGWVESERIARELGDDKRAAEAITRQGDLARRVGFSKKTIDEADAWYDEAGEKYGAARQVWSGVRPADEDGRRERDRMIARVDRKAGQAEVYRAWTMVELEGDAERASEALRSGMDRTARAITELDRLSEGAPEDATLARERFLAARDFGLATEVGASLAVGLGGTDEDRREMLAQALETFEQAGALTRELAMDRSNLEAQRDLGIVMLNAAEVRHEMGDLDGAFGVIEELETLRRGIYQEDPTQRHHRDLVPVIFLRGEVYEDMAKAAENEGERVAYLRSAGNAFRSTLGIVRELEADGVPMESERNACERALARVAASLGPSDP